LHTYCLFSLLKLVRCRDLRGTPKPDYHSDSDPVGVGVGVTSKEISEVGVGVGVTSKEIFGVGVGVGFAGKKLFGVGVGVEIITNSDKVLLFPKSIN